MSFTWKPITFEELNRKIETGMTEMSPRERVLWSFLRVVPQKWSLTPWADLGGGFWVVAIRGETCIYYNDIENGFNVSKFTRHGVIDEYFCNQDELQWQIQRIMEAIDAGARTAAKRTGFRNALQG